MIKLLIDESVDYLLTSFLREAGFEVLSILEEYPGISDDQVLKISTKLKALLLTEDKDFGDLVVRFNKSNCGILLIRFSGSPQKKKTVVLQTLKNHYEEMINNFTVLSEDKIRIRKIE